MSSIAPEILFKTMLKSFASTLRAEAVRLSELGVQIPNILIIDMIINTIKEYPDVLIIEKFIEKSFENNESKFWIDIKNRNDKELIEGIGKVFGNLPNISYFNNILDSNDANGKPYVSKETKEKVFKFVDTFIRHSIKYIHLKREPTIENGKRIYKVDYCNHIDLDKYSEMFNVKGLNF